MVVMQGMAARHARSRHRAARRDVTSPVGEFRRARQTTSDLIIAESLTHAQVHAALEVLGLPDFRLLMEALGVGETAAGIEETAEAIIRARNRGALLDLLRGHGIRPGNLLRGRPVGQLSLMAQKDIAASLVENVVFLRRFERAMQVD